VSKDLQHFDLLPAQRPEFGLLLSALDLVEHRGSDRGADSGPGVRMDLLFFRGC
jgi:hypothetical protein